MISRNPSTLWTKLDESVVLLNIELARYYETNAVGSLIWDLLDEPRTLDEIVEEVVSRYRVEREQCEGDVLRFLEALEKGGLLASEEAAPGAPAPA